MPSNDTEHILSTPLNEGEAQPIPATRIGYDNDTSGLTADTVQEAIDEMAGDIALITKLPALPSEATAGTYVLKATKADDTVTYSWVAEV